VQKLILIILLCLPWTSAGAESIELQDGTTVEGKILSVGPETVRIEVQTSPTIREEKTYPRSEVTKVRRAGPDDLAFEDIARLAAPGTADDPAVYDALIEPVRLFMKNYAYSKHMPQARQLSATLESERARLASGEVKVDGEWIPKDASPAERTEIGGRVQLSKMKASPDAAAALAAFEVLEKNHPASSAYPEAVPVALASIEKLRAAIVRASADLDRRTREQEEGLKLASEDRRRQMEAGIAQEKAAVQAQIDRVRQNGGKWLPVLPDGPALEDLSRVSDSEKQRLEKVDTQKLSEAVAKARRAGEQLEAGDLEGAKTSLDEAKTLWPQYGGLAPLQESLKKAQEEAKKAAKRSESEAKPTPSPTPPATQSSWKLNQDIRVAARAETPYRLEWRATADGWREIQLEFIADSMQSEYSPPRGWIAWIGDSLTDFFARFLRSDAATGHEPTTTEWAAVEIDATAAGDISRRWILTGRRGNSGSREPVSDSFRFVWEENKLEAIPEAATRSPGASVVTTRIISRALRLKNDRTQTRRHSPGFTTVFARRAKEEAKPAAS
jgi:hypothetical protein